MLLGRIVTMPIRRASDWDLAEQCAQEAFTEALRRWPMHGKLTVHNRGEIAAWACEIAAWAWWTGIVTGRPQVSPAWLR